MELMSGAGTGIFRGITNISDATKSRTLKGPSIIFEFLSKICLDFKPDRRDGEVAASAGVGKENVILHGLIK
jgi:hypothetical protein